MPKDNEMLGGKNMRYSYNTKDVCAVKVDFEVENGVVKNVVYTGGCEGNHKGLSKLIEGMKVDEVIERLSGIKCGRRNSSCPEQLANALKALKEGKL